MHLFTPQDLSRECPSDIKNEIQYIALTLIWVGFLGVPFEVGGGTKITPCLNHVRINMLIAND